MSAKQVNESEPEFGTIFKVLSDENFYQKNAYSLGKPVETNAGRLIGCAKLALVTSPGEKFGW